MVGSSVIASSVRIFVVFHPGQPQTKRRAAGLHLPVFEWGKVRSEDSKRSPTRNPGFDIASLQLRRARAAAAAQSQSRMPSALLEELLDSGWVFGSPCPQPVEIVLALGGIFGHNGRSSLNWFMDREPRR